MNTKERQQVRHLLVIKDDGGRRTVPLEAATYSLGRHASNSIVCHSPHVSRQHALLLRMTDPETGNFFFRIVDGNLQGKRSINGVTVNGKRCASHNLKHGDLIVLGGDIKARYHVISNVSDTGFRRYSEEVQGSGLPKTTDIGLGFQPITPSSQELSNLSEAALIRLSSFPEMNPNPILEVDLDGRITYLNPAAVQQFPELKHNTSHPLLQGLAELGQDEEQKYLVRELELDDHIFEQTIHCLSESHLVRCYLVDITQRKLTEHALRESEERYAAAARGANDGLWDWDLRTNQIYFSPRWKLILGWHEEEIGKNPEEWFDRIHHEDRERVKAELHYHLNGSKAHFESEHRLLHRDGSYRWVRSRGLALCDEDAIPYRIAGSLTDITAYRLVQEQILHDALHDALTGLPNRVLLLDRLAQAIHRARRHSNYQFAVLFLDLDRFKVINDSLGHMAGDRLLVEIAQRLQRCLHSEDTIARLGGDEFAILVEDIQSVEAVLQLVERLHAELNRPLSLDNQDIFTTASIGIAFNSPQTEQPEELLRDADVAMYRAKSLGKNRHEIFSAGMRLEAIAQLQVETELRHALERQELRVYYQPIIQLNEGILYGFETLVRWEHPQRGLVLPLEFLPIAEETGLIVPISWWVLQQACEQMQLWQQQFPCSQFLNISVNFTPQHFAQPSFLQKLNRILAETKFPPHRLRLEVTENLFMKSTETTIDILQELQEWGIQIYLDDFGTGYSSLNYLHRFPINTLKIDRCFIGHLNSNASHASIVQAIMTLAHVLGLAVIAEGVETVEQLHQLCQLQCEFGQGYLFSTPLSQTQIAEYLAKNDLAWHNDYYSGNRIVR